MVFFEYDKEKSATNLKKHKIDFDTAIEVFHDPFALTGLDRIVDGEERYKTLGIVNHVLLVVVTHTMTDENNDTIIRIISARKANKAQRREYYDNNQD